MNDFDDFDDEQEFAEGDGDLLDGASMIDQGGVPDPSDATGIAPSFTWGSSATIDVPGAVPAFTPLASVQLAQVSLPEPAVCSIYVEAVVTRNDNVLDTVRALTLNFNQGVGRVTVPRQDVFPFQPQVGAPLKFTLEFVPLHALNVDAQLTVDTISGAPHMTVQLSFLLAPITRIDTKAQKLAFGMAMPGEADAMDDELRGELEAEGPTVVQTVLAEHGEGHLPGQRVQRVPPWLTRLVHELSQRLGRKPERAELAAAVRRLQARNRRRAQRFG